MKRIVFIVLAFALSFTDVAAQKSKIAHINSNELLLLMPERQQAESTLQSEAEALQKQLETMTTELQKKVAEYRSKEATLSDLLKQTKQEEIGGMEDRIRNFQTNAEKALQDREVKLLEPIVEKAKAAIKEVAAANGYTYVLDSSVGVVIEAPDADDLLPLVKKKLGIMSGESAPQ